MSPEEHRTMAENEADLDLDKKDIRHLLCDIHDESLRRGRPFLETQIHANKRIASLSAKIAVVQQQASADLLSASNQLLEASKEGTRNQVAYAERAHSLAQDLSASNKRSASLLDAINNFITEQQSESTRIQHRVDRLNRWMLGFTVLGSIFAALSIWISWQSLDLQRRENEKKKAPVSVDQTEKAQSNKSSVSLEGPIKDEGPIDPKSESLPSVSPQTNSKPVPVPDSKENL